MASLIYHAGALGDFITTLPAIARWREELPGERLILLGRPAHAAIAAPPFDETWDAGAAVFSPLFSDGVKADSPLSGKLSVVTSALLFAAASSPLAASLARLGVSEIVRQDPFPSSVIHVIDYHLSFFPGQDRGEQRIPQILVPRTEPWDVAAIHPGSGSAKKNWPRARFIELAARLVERGVRISWILGPAETDIEPPPSADQNPPSVATNPPSVTTNPPSVATNPPSVATNPPSVAVWRSLPLPTLAGRLARCRLYVGNDSGVTHLAAAAGCPTVALFGESDPRVWAPRGTRVKVLMSGSHGMGAIGVGDVLRVCEDFLKEK
ncbi:MAG: glycosyltransferase family 9 protein [Spirochaetia bacterium]|jgi:ADP-heptose:LPS heptosyltransferase